MEIVSVSSGEPLEQVRTLFEEYWNSFGFTSCFQNFGDEWAKLPGDYVPPGGRLALALVNGERAGCAAMRHFDPDRCEAKRLHVRPAFRGRRLAHAIRHASRQGRLRLFT